MWKELSYGRHSIQWADNSLLGCVSAVNHCLTSILLQLNQLCELRWIPINDIFNFVLIRIQQLEKDLYYYKKTSRDLKKKLREVMLRLGEQAAPGFSADVHIEESGIEPLDYEPHNRNSPRLSPTGTHLPPLGECESTYHRTFLTETWEKLWGYHNMTQSECSELNGLIIEACIIFMVPIIKSSILSKVQLVLKKFFFKKLEHQIFQSLKFVSYPVFMKIYGESQFWIYIYHENGRIR